MTRVKFRKQTGAVSCACSTDCLYILTFHRGSLTAWPHQGHYWTRGSRLLAPPPPNCEPVTNTTQNVVLNQVGRGGRRNILHWANHRDILITTQKKVEPNTNWLGSYRINNPCTEPLLKSTGGFVDCTTLYNINARPCLELHIQKKRRFWEQFPQLAFLFHRLLLR